MNCIRVVPVDQYPTSNLERRAYPVICCVGYNQYTVSTRCVAKERGENYCWPDSETDASMRFVAPVNRSLILALNGFGGLSFKLPSQPNAIFE